MNIESLGLVAKNLRSPISYINCPVGSLLPGVKSTSTVDDVGPVTSVSLVRPGAGEEMPGGYIPGGYIPEVQPTGSTGSGASRARWSTWAPTYPFQTQIDTMPLAGAHT